MKTVSVVICTYNGENYLREQLDSLIHQTLQPTEVILQDDGSSDHTIEIAHSYCDKLNLKIYKNETNLGFSKNFESTISKATGDLIALCDQDDIWEKNKLELLTNALGNESFNLSEGFQKLDFIYAGNIAQAFLKTLSRIDMFSSYESLNIGSGNTYSVREVVSILEELLGVTLQKTWGPPSTVDNPIIIVSRTKAKEQLDWEPKISLRSGLQETIKYYQENLR